ncbi:unnamed protein product [Schistocephalus solidus]|uniref:Uncharacterized protein n=1 Tax=Schistocephalus solidus TaxID=70667 RepID=A0A183TUE7_SCHSO|nr:unnamed protein product [Schistocephalus solidus]
MEMPCRFADKLLRLARDVFPSCSAVNWDQVVLFNFKRRLSSQEVTEFIRNQPPGDLNDSIVRASRMLQADTIQPEVKAPTRISRSSSGPRNFSASPFITPRNPHSSLLPLIPKADLF